ncbi:LCP family protein [Planomonospora alba]
MHLGQDSGDVTGESGKRRSRRRGARPAQPGDTPDAPAGRAPGTRPGKVAGADSEQAGKQAAKGDSGPARAGAAQAASGAASTPAGTPAGTPDGRGSAADPAAAPSPSAAPKTAAPSPGAAPEAAAGPPSGTGGPSAPGGGGSPGAASPAGPGPASGPAARPRFARPLTTGALIGWTALSAVLPGAAHLRAGRRRTGYVLLGAFVALLVAAVVTALVLSGNVGVATRDGVLTTAVVLAGAGALAWFLLVVSSYITLGPGRLNGQGQIVSGIAAGLLAVAVMAPFALTATTVMTAKQLTNDIFPSTPEDGSSAAPVKHEDPWNGRDRVNFLLIGGDGAGNREGVRTDSMNVASIHIKTGNTVMFSLPRNLQHVRFPPSSPLAKQFPNGFMRELPNGGLLNEVWQYAEDHPEIMGRKHQGPRALMDAIGYTLNLDIDYYALINMYGFAHLVDAIGGLKIRVDQDIKYGGSYGTAGTIKAGHRTLSGEEALWYGRSRVGSDDFSRMARQRCVIGAFAKQATPTVVLANFTKIASAAKRMAQTNIPRDLLEHLTELALRVKDAKITSLQFVPPEFYTGSPDWQKIRTATARALRQSVQPSRARLAAGRTATPGTGGASPTPTLSAPVMPTAAKTPSKSPTANKDAQSLDELCGL